MDLLEQYILARWCYAIGNEGKYSLTDSDYRVLEDKVKELYPDNEYVNRSWSNDPCPMELLKKYNVMDLYVDLKFVHQSESIPSITEEQEFESTFRNLNKRTRVSFKLDGWNTQINYYNGAPISAETRGRTGNSLNANVVTQVVPQSIDNIGMIKVTAETLIPNALWGPFKEETGNVSQRASVRTALATERVDVLKPVAFNVQYEDSRPIEDKYALLQSMGFETPMNFIVNNYKELCVAVKKLCAIASKYKYPTDGIVVENEDIQRAIRCFEPYREKLLMSYVVGLEERLGYTGRNIVAKIRPVKAGDKTARTVSITNLSYAYAFNLCEGAPIAFVDRSAANAVLNTVGTQLIQNEWRGKWSEYKDYIDSFNADVE